MSNEKSRSGGGKVRTDGRGRSVWADTVNTAKFELVSTQELRAILDATNDDRRESIEKVAASGEDGVLARNTDTGLFHVLDEASLREILGSETPQPDQPADVTLEPLSNDDGSSLSLVSTQALRKIIAPGPAADGAQSDELEAEILDTGGFDPYNST